MRGGGGAVAGSVAALAAIFGAGLPGGGPGSADPSNGGGGDPLRGVADACLEGLAEVARLQARAAAVKVRLTCAYVRVAEALAPPAVSPQQRTAWEMAVVAEVACVVTVSERAAGALITGSRALCSGLPLTLAALQAGELSWQHARVMVEETTGLDRAGTAGMEAHFLDPAAPDPARGCPAGDLVPGRFRAKARPWRERHHRVSIEARHLSCAADRRVESSPDRDGMAWFTAYLPAAGPGTPRRPPTRKIPTHGLKQAPVVSEAPSLRIIRPARSSIHRRPRLPALAGCRVPSPGLPRQARCAEARA